MCVLLALVCVRSNFLGVCLCWEIQIITPMSVNNSANLHRRDDLKWSFQTLQLIVDVLFVIWSTHGKKIWIPLRPLLIFFLSFASFCMQRKRGTPLEPCFIVLLLSFSCKSVPFFLVVCIRRTEDPIFSSAFGKFVSAAPSRTHLDPHFFSLLH